MKRIQLTQQRFAIVDDEDYERVNAFKWRASLESRGTKIYAKRRARTSELDRWQSHSVRLHHFILDVAPCELPAGCVVDHLNHDSLDNRKSNLEIVTQAENMRRSEGWKKKPVECFL